MKNPTSRYFGTDRHPARSVALTRATWIAALAAAGALAATAQVRAQTVVNNSFETPVIGTSDGDLTHSHGTPNSPSGESYEYAALFSGSFTGWNVAYTATNGMQATGQAPNWGVDDPASSQFGSSEPLPTPFDGNQYFYLNLRSSSDGSQTDSGTLTSDSLGALAAGTYDLTIALGARPQTSWRGVEYQIGLFDLSTSAQLGTFSDAVLVPGDSASDNVIAGSYTTPGGFGNSYNILDLNYQLTLGAGDGHLGDSYAVRVNMFVDSTTGNATGTFTQPTLDNVRLTLVPEPAAMALMELGVLLFGLARLRRRS